MQKGKMTKMMLTVLILVMGSRLFGQSLIQFEYSDCLKNCVGDSSKITVITKSNHLTMISLTTYAPCSGNFAGGLEAVGKRLNLKFWTKPTITYKRKNERKETIEVADCNCLFEFKYSIKDLSTVDIKEIKVNGQTLREIDSENILTEIEIR